jgi:hypothetical protein
LQAAPDVAIQALTSGRGFTGTGGDTEPTSNAPVSVNHRDVLIPDRDGVVTIKEVYDYVYEKTKEATSGVQHPL